MPRLNRGPAGEEAADNVLVLVQFYYWAITCAGVL